MNLALVALLNALVGSPPAWSCVPDSDGEGWRCLRNQRAPQSPLVTRQQRPLVDDPWQPPALSPLRPDAIVSLEQITSWQWQRDAADAIQPWSGEPGRQRVERPQHRRSTPVPQAPAERQARAPSSNAALIEKPAEPQRQGHNNAEQGEYWVQLMAFRQPSSIDNVETVAGLNQERLRVVTGGRLRQLVLGPFPGFSQAEAARRALPASFSGGFVRHAPGLRTQALARWRQQQR